MVRRRKGKSKLSDFTQLLRPKSFDELVGQEHLSLPTAPLRILCEKGILVFKCQDTISGGKQYLSHVEIINMAVRLGFYPKDLFILLSKNRLMSPNQRNQKHCRKFHSYFVVRNIYLLLGVF
jgi:hypothetical protein